MAEISSLFDSEFGAAALVGGDAVVIGADMPGHSIELEETSRHEVAHLFSGYLGSNAPLLKGEGLATWLQGTERAIPIDARALASLLHEPWSPLGWLVSCARFDESKRDAYALAGSFTGYLRMGDLPAVLPVSWPAGLRGCVPGVLPPSAGAGRPRVA
jgi:hypothetical protein